MDAEVRDLPFVPPATGCKIESVRRVGPFITQVRLTLPDGRPYVWKSRGHRFRGGGQAPSTVALGERDEVRWWHAVALAARIIWWTSALFVIGAACFAASSAAGLAPQVFGGFGDDPSAMNLVFFVGSIFFTTAAYLQFLAAVNAEMIAAITQRKRPTERFRWFAYRPSEIGWLSAFAQLVGTLLFNINTIDALLPGLDWWQADLLIWTPDAAGSILFLIASALALLEYSGARDFWRPHDVSWWIVNVNMLGSIAFGISAVYAVVLPGATDALDVAAVNAWTLIGAVCFLAGAVLLLPEARRNLQQAVAQSPR